MRSRALALDPAVDGIMRYAMVNHGPTYGVPPFRMSRTKMVAHSRISSQEVGNRWGADATGLSLLDGMLSQATSRGSMPTAGIQASRNLSRLW